MREHSGEFLCLRWVRADEGIDPYEFFSGLSEEPGDCDRRESPEGGCLKKTKCPNRRTVIANQ